MLTPAGQSNVMNRVIHFANKTLHQSVIDTDRPRPTKSGTNVQPDVVEGTPHSNNEAT